jgi:hypothetical protein
VRGGEGLRWKTLETNLSHRRYKQREREREREKENVCGVHRRGIRRAEREKERKKEEGWARGSLYLSISPLSISIFLSSLSLAMSKSLLLVV